MKMAKIVVILIECNGHVKAHRPNPVLESLNLNSVFEVEASFTQGS